MMALWSDPIVQLILKTANVRVEEIGGFYLDQLPRVTEERYVPTNGRDYQTPYTVTTDGHSDDILRARLKTVGVTEYRFQMKPSENGHIGSGITLGSDFRIFDVGGHRSLVRQLTCKLLLCADCLHSEVTVDLWLVKAKTKLNAFDSGMDTILRRHEW